MSYPKNILIADDDLDDLEMFELALQETCSIKSLKVAKDGAELLKMVHTSPKPDMIFMDLNMPLKNGKECLQYIRCEEEFNDVPVIVLTTSTSTYDIDDCMKLGANEYIVKPDSFTALKNIVGNICNCNTK